MAKPADTDINILGGTLILSNSGTASKGINADGNVTVSGGSTTINLSGATLLNASGNGFDPSYPTGIKADGKITISSGKVTVTGTAAATGTKGISADADIEISGGTINITTAGAGAKYTNTTGATDSYSSVAISGDANVIISGGSLTTSSEPRLCDSGGLEILNFQFCTKISNSLLLFSKFMKKEI